MLKIVPRKIDDLHGYARNSRVHSDAQVNQLMASLAEFGWTKPCLTDGNNGLVAGHGILAAARRLRAAGTKIPHWPDTDMVPTVDLAHLTPAQKRAYVIADNKLAMNSSFDDEMLSLEVGELQDDGFDIRVIGFDPAELDAMLGGPDLDPVDVDEQPMPDDGSLVHCPACGHGFVA
jgi:ParB-like chromosome segregation protein Spo0J